MGSIAEPDFSRQVRLAAEVSVARGCAFAGLATLCLMIGLAGDVSSCLKGGGYAALLTCTVLLLKAGFAMHKPYRDTETWIILDEAFRPHESIAQQVVSEALRHQYLRFARFHALAAAVLLVLGITLGIVLG